MVSRDMNRVLVRQLVIGLSTIAATAVARSVLHRRVHAGKPLPNPVTEVLPAVAGLGASLAAILALENVPYTTMSSSSGHKVAREGEFG